MTNRTHPEDPVVEDGGVAIGHPDGQVELTGQVGGAPSASAREAATATDVRRSADPHYVEGGYEPGPAPEASAPEPRSWFDRVGDEFKALIGDAAAKARLDRDHRIEERAARGGGDWRGHDDDTGWRDPITPEVPPEDRR